MDMKRKKIRMEYVGNMGEDILIFKDLTNRLYNVFFSPEEEADGLVSCYQIPEDVLEIIRGELEKDEIAEIDFILGMYFDKEIELFTAIYPEDMWEDCLIPKSKNEGIIEFLVK